MYGRRVIKDGIIDTLKVKRDDWEIISIIL